MPAMMALVALGADFVRIRTERDGQFSAPSNEVTVTGCQAPPAPPSLSANLYGQTVVVQWTFPSYPVGCFPSSLRLEAGRFGVPSGPSNEVRLDIGCLPPPEILDPRSDVVGNASPSLSRRARRRGSQSRIVARSPAALTGFNVAGAEGSYFTRSRATNACGSTVSPELPVTLTGECMAPDGSRRPLEAGDGSTTWRWGRRRASRTWHAAPWMAATARANIGSCQNPPAPRFLWSRWTAARSPCGGAGPSRPKRHTGRTSRSDALLEHQTP